MIDYKYKGLFNQNSVEKQVTISYENTTITNEDLFNNEMTIEESLCSENQLKFGSCEASMVKFKVANIFSPMVGKTIDISVVLESHAESPFRYGRYKVQSDKPTADREWREIVAYDAMYDIINADVTDWYNTVLPKNDSSVTLRQFRKSFVEHFGLKESDATLVNDGMVVKKTISVQTNSGEDDNASVIKETNGLSGLTVMNAICEINGCFGHIGRDGNMHYIYLAPNIFGLFPSNDLYPADDVYPNDPDVIPASKSLYISCKYEDYKCKKIEKLQIRTEENDIGTIVGDGNNAYIIEGNFIAYGKNSEELKEIAENIFDKIKDVSYIPFNADCIGNPCIEVGDAVRFPTTYKIVESYVLKRTLKGIQALRDSYSSTGAETYEKKVNSVQNSIVALKGKTNRLDRTVEETVSSIANLEEKTESQIKQTANSILTTVAFSEKKWDESGYYIEYYGYGLPLESYSPSEEYYGRYYLDQASGKVYICNRVLAMNGYYYYWSPVTDLPLVTAQLNSKIEQTSSAISAEVKRALGVESSLSGKINLTESNITAEVNRAISAESSLSSQIQMTADSITSTVASSQKTWDETGLDIDYYGYGHPSEKYAATEEQIGNQYLDQKTGNLYTCEWTPVPYGYALHWGLTTTLPSITSELSSEIKQTAGSISLKVSKDELITEINQSAETIELSAGRLVITSGNFTIDRAGNVSVSGDIKARSGSFGPLTVSQNGEDSKVVVSDFNGSTTLMIDEEGLHASHIYPIYGTNATYVDGKLDVLMSVRAQSYSSNGASVLQYKELPYGVHLGQIDWSSDNPDNTLDDTYGVYLCAKNVKMIGSANTFIDIHTQTSDERYKHKISQIDPEKAAEFIKWIVPISYQYKEDTGTTPHWGFGAQTTLSAMKESGLGESRLIERNPNELGGDVAPDDDGTFIYSMKMDELAAPYAAAIQYILNEIETIKNQIGGQ